jgi:hypothetical protein
MRRLDRLPLVAAARAVLGDPGSHFVIARLTRRDVQPWLRQGCHQRFSVATLPRTRATEHERERPGPTRVINRH